MSDPKKAYPRVPFIDLSHQIKLVKQDFLKKVEKIIDDKDFISGSNASRLSAILCSQEQFSGTFVPCANGTDALWLALKAINRTNKKLKIGCPNLTFWASCEAIVNTGNVPVFIDVDRNYFQLSFNALQSAHQDHKIDAVVMPHLFGWCSPDLPAIRTFCEAENITLIEDGAQSFGVKWEDEPICAQAKILTTSFYPAKVFGGCMDGGGIFVRDPVLADRIQKLANHGRSAHYGFDQIGTNSRMSAIQAAFLCSLSTKIPELMSERNRLLAKYDACIQSLDVEACKLLKPPSQVRGNGYLACCLIAEREAELIQKQMQDVFGVTCARTYPSLMTEQTAKFEFVLPKSTPIASNFSKSILNPPLFYGLTDAQIVHVVSSLRNCLC